MGQVPPNQDDIGSSVDDAGQLGSTIVSVRSLWLYAEVGMDPVKNSWPNKKDSVESNLGVNEA